MHIYLFIRVNSVDGESARPLLTPQPLSESHANIRPPVDDRPTISRTCSTSVDVAGSFDRNISPFQKTNQSASRGDNIIQEQDILGESNSRLRFYFMI